MPAKRLNLLGSCGCIHGRPQRAESGDGNPINGAIATCAGFRLFDKHVGVTRQCGAGVRASVPGERTTGLVLDDAGLEEIAFLLEVDHLAHPGERVLFVREQGLQADLRGAPVGDVAQIALEHGGIEAQHAARHGVLGVAVFELDAVHAGPVDVDGVVGARGGEGDQVAHAGAVGRQAQRPMQGQPGRGAGMQGVADRSAYNASKHGLIGLTRTLAVEWGARGVRVNAVCPGWVKTEMDHKDQAGGSYTDEDITDHVPMGRFARPDDIAQAIAWLCDANKSGFVNGISLPVDGGWTADGSWQSLRLRHRDD